MTLSIFKTMTAAILTLTAATLWAQEAPKPKAPDSKAYSDVLESLSEKVSKAEGAPPKTPSLEVERALAEARLLLGQVAEQAGGHEQDMRSAFQSALDLISQRLKALPGKPAKRAHDAPAAELSPALDAEVSRAPEIREVSREGFPPPRTEKANLTAAPLPEAAKAVLPPAAPPNPPHGGDLRERLRALAAELRRISEELEAHVCEEIVP